MADDKDAWPRKEEAQSYMDEHRVMELFNNMTAQLMYNRPDDPKGFLVGYLEKMMKARTTSMNHPCLFEDENVASVFGMLDPTSKGYISKSQYEEALKTLGITNYEQKPMGWENDRIATEIFKREAKKGLMEASATFKKPQK